ncbi:divergent protein kinase domain 1C-like [Haliotis rubra]|uniref:divergent protein kinase domain 1C-like n=1 Tax=Haliotis rubra TaxID=36100 RepID=UPI001EE58F98|nr:divergent protein kinase domain 1C-like [Haliotis rubra]XP_046550609.1 divergent protein kinase domain 1C-like [Haliotis rubra]XP_046550610.1 divergent protein kinase domain 1C-like [Haliotis rubra]XP_046550611.1 divergent protein kinase domain 1C-like [Haliotis rubra]
MRVTSFGLRCRRPKRVLIICVLLLLLVGCLYLVQVVQEIIHDMSCSEQESHEVLQQYCQMYRDKRIVGDLCPHLCGNDPKVQYKKCTNYRQGKRVFIVQCLDFCQEGATVKAVLKTNHKNFSDFLNEEFSFEREDQENNGPSIDFLQTMIKDTLQMDLHMTLPKETDPIAFMWKDNYFDYYKKNNKNSQFALARSVWSLVRQSEYLMMKANQEHQFMPQLYGTCGPLYLMEYAPPGDMLEHEVQFTNFPWVVRARVAKGILGILWSVQEDMHEPMHLCDVKGENFGVSEDGQVKLIDTDTVFYDSKMLDELALGNCSRNNECNFFDCRGWCDAKTGSCAKFRINNNLQSVCQDVFLGKLMDSVGGLLRNPLVPSRLNSNPSWTNVLQSDLEDGIPSKTVRGIILAPI